MRRLLPPLLVTILLGSQAVATALPGPRFVDGSIRWVGLAVGLLGVALTVHSARLFERRSTNIVTFDDPDVLVADGVFAWTRNPMYLGFTVLLVGSTIMSGAWAAWLGPAVFGVVANLWYIPFEERRLHSVFGDDYERYRRRVGRWFRRLRPREVVTR